MPFNAVQLVPGVNTQKTLSLNQAGVSVSQLIRYREGLIEAYGGWNKLVSAAVPSTVRDMRAWQDAAGNTHLASAATGNLIVLTSGSAQDIMPQTYTTNSSIKVTINGSSSNPTNVVQITDPNSSGIPSIFDTVFFNTPLAFGNVFINGPYQIQSVGSSIIYNISLLMNTTTNVSTATIASSNMAGFNTTSGSPNVQVTLSNNGYLKQQGLFYSFNAPTTVDGITVSGPYQITSITDSTAFFITATAQASATSSGTMNSTLAQIVYYVALGPQSGGGGFGSGGFGSGGFGSGFTVAGVPGNPITTTDWTLDNWGEVLLACPTNGAIYAWSPDSGLQNAQAIATAPFFNGGIFVSMPQQILVAWKSTLYLTGVQDNLTIRWSNAGDFTNWNIINATSAGSFRIPTGSVIKGGMQGPSQGFIWTDVDVWAMNYIGGTLIFNFTRIGNGGLVGPHAMASIAGGVYWMGPDNFYNIGAGGMGPLACTVWDAVFQNINSANINKVRCATNTLFNEVAWFYPSASATENDSYVKYNLLEGEWDNGTLNRTVWIDQSVLGNPIGADSLGFVYQHETGTATTGTNPSFSSGWWSIAEGDALAFVDFILPDFKFGTFSGAQGATMTLTFQSADYPGGPTRTYGPYTISSTTQYINTRIRGRLMSVKVTGDGVSFWRLGRLRYRAAPAGKR